MTTLLVNVVTKATLFNNKSNTALLLSAISITPLAAAPLQELLEDNTARATLPVNTVTKTFLFSNVNRTALPPNARRPAFAMDAQQAPRLAVLIPAPARGGPPTGSAYLALQLAQAMLQTLWGEDLKKTRPIKDNFWPGARIDAPHSHLAMHTWC